MFCSIILDGHQKTMQASIRLVSIVVSVLYSASLVLYAISNGLPDWYVVLSKKLNQTV